MVFVVHSSSMIQKTHINTSKLGLLNTTDITFPDARFLHVVMTSIMVRCLLSIISTSLNALLYLSRGYSDHSCRLVLIFFILPPFYRCANIVPRYHLPTSALVAIPTQNSTLINGLGRYSGGPSSALAVINVSSGKRYRFRLVAISCDPNFVFSIVNHNLVSYLIWYRFL